MAASLPKNDAEKKAMESGTAAPAAPPEKPAAPPPKPPPDKPAAVTAPAATAQDPDEEILSGKRNPKSEDYKRVKHAATEANKRADELKAQHEAATKELAELRKNRGDADKMAKLEKELVEVKGKWQAVAAQFDSGFNAKYEQLLNSEMDKIKDAIPADRADKIKQLFQMPESEWKRKAMAELTEDLDTPTVTDIMIANRAVRDIMAARKKELDDSGNVLKASAEQRQKEQEERKAAYAKSFDAVLSKKSTGDEAIPVLQTREGDSPEVKAWNEGVAERAAVARAVFMDQFDSPEEKAEASIWAASAPGFLAELKAAQSRVAELEKTLAAIQGASPGMGIAGKGAEGGQKMTFQERMAAAAI